jgi:hypothetical protein
MAAGRAATGCFHTVSKIFATAILGPKIEAF